MGPFTRRTHRFPAVNLCGSTEMNLACECVDESQQKGE